MCMNAFISKAVSYIVELLLFSKEDIFSILIYTKMIGSCILDMKGLSLLKEWC